ncbi:Sorbitol dehydrogenase [Nesidiocoris tenuis]|uniref:Sorbitol dehydrogenase n=1 Tax=Nesidiocoris tenuis TaxID=355587 RepID=A0ABN7AQ15_9HEMI|nr:Sorbitol dehydrogenase [Nesidiocoris tenuis]
MAPNADNLTAVLYKVNDLRLENRPIPEPKDDEVLLKMGSVGICGSDVHYLVHGRISDFVVKEPMIMGHEAAGTVAKVGKNVKNLKVGDRVAIEPGVPCRICDFCKEGKYNLCLEMVFCATPPVHGNLSRYYVHAADFCFKLPPHVSLEEGALLEPLSVGVHACRRAGVGLGSNVLVLGAGPIGLVTILTAKAMGASKVLAIDLLDDRLALAKNCGADLTLKISRDDSPANVAKKVEEVMGAKPDKTMDCTGFSNTINIGLESTKSGGCFVLVGMGASEVKIPLVSYAIREIDIRGVFRYCNDYPLALDMVASGKVNVKQLITHRFELEETVKAFDTAKTGAGNPVKIMIRCNKD